MISIIRNSEDCINNNIFKILLFKKDLAWSKEIADMLLKISIIKSRHNKGFLEYGLYKKLLYDEPFENGVENPDTSVIKMRSKIILDDEEYLGLYSEYRDKIIPIDDWKLALLQFYDEVCDYLSKGLLVRQIIFDLIEDLFFDKILSK